MISKFLQATIARNAPLLDVAQVAAIRNMTVAELDAHVRKNSEEEQADFALDLRQWNADMESYIVVKDVRSLSPCVREYLYDNLCIDARQEPVGTRQELPKKEREPYRSVEEAMEAFFPRRKSNHQ